MRALAERLRGSDLYAFNLVRRDAWIAQQAAALPAGSRVLDVGAGSCPYRRFFAHCEYRTQDFAQLSNEQLRNGGYGRIDYVCDATAIPVDAASFDAVLCSEVLEHVPEPILLVRELGRVLRPGGRLILTAPLGSGLHQEPFHFYGGYTPHWYFRFLNDAGFTDVRVEPNAGFFKLWTQETLRFVGLARPTRLEMPFAARLLWWPIWVVLSAALLAVVPPVGAFLSRYERNPSFTVGYHVTAVRRDDQGPR